MTSFALWRRFPSPRWIVAGLIAFAAVYMIYWLCAVYRLNHPEIRPKLRLAAEMLAVPVSEDERNETDPERIAVVRKLVSERIETRFDELARLYHLPTGSPYPFEFRSRDPEEVESFNECHRVQLRAAFLEAATDLALAVEYTRAFNVALVRLESVGRFWNNGTPQNLAPYERWFRNSHRRQGTSFGLPLPLGDAGSIREGAALYLNHRNDFDFWPPEDVRQELAGLPTTVPAMSYRSANFRHLARFVDPSFVYRPWQLLAWSDPGFYHNCTRQPLVILAITLTTFFFLDIRYSGWGLRKGEQAGKSIFVRIPKSPRRSTVLARWKATRRVRPERFWLSVSFTVAAVIVIVGEAHETWPEWLTTFTILPVAAILLSALIGSLAAMSRTPLTVEFRQLSQRKRFVHLAGFTLAASATLIMALWTAYYSFFGLALSFDGGKALRGLLQVVLALLVTYWLFRLMMHLLEAPLEKSPETRLESNEQVPDPNFAQTAVGSILKAAAVTFLPFGAAALSNLVESL